jgi:hypothetical protein
MNIQQLSKLLQLASTNEEVAGLLSALATPDAPNQKEGDNTKGIQDFLSASFQHTKAPGNAMAAQNLSGPGGLFSVVGAENTVMSTYVRPRGLGEFLRAVGNNNTDPRYPVFVGYDAESGTEPDYPCEDAPMPGPARAATLMGQYGRIMRQSRTIEIDDVFRRSRVDVGSFRLMGSMFGTDNPLSPGRNMSQNDVLNLVVASQMASMGVAFERKLTQLMWRGTPANNTTNGGYKEFPGLDSQIATGQLDAESGTAVPALDSYIANFGYALVDNTTTDIVNVIHNMERYLFDKAERQGLSPVEWVFVMRPDLWYELTAIWPCRYLTNRCADASGTEVMVINDRTNVDERDRMRRDQMLEVNGRRYRVVLDDGIYEKNNTIDAVNVPAGTFSSSIYFIPLRLQGNFPATYWEHMDYSSLGRELRPLGGGSAKPTFWTDGGRFMWTIRHNGFCFDLQAKVEPRVILAAPQLAGKIQNVRYASSPHLVSPYPGTDGYLNGGVTSRTVTTGEAVWNQ